ncbi:uncharacterized protein LOC111336855 [Stylophora pistillata]|uniref:uncharacterized protein LOC111336855 n=1 Tax=Stylophora pistillata TaxID=50429 RepID=UPI000C03B7A1|nr:uncharacterized protein LOC111336855 [Stylophora pistillata]
MKRYEYGLLAALPPVFFLIVCFIVILWKFRDLKLLASSIAKMAFSDILKVKKKKEDGKPKWLFKDIDLTCEKGILFTILATSLMLFTGMLTGTLVMFWQLLLVEVSSDCDVEDPSKDCFEVKFWGWPKQDPVNCSSASIQDGTTQVLCYKIVFNFGVATGASYGAFKLSMLAYSLGSSVLLMINHEKYNNSHIQFSRLPMGHPLEKADRIESFAGQPIQYWLRKPRCRYRRQLQA